LDVEAKKEDETADEKETNKATKVADRRNLERVDKADEIDRNLLSKCYLPESIDEFIPNVVPGPHDSFIPPAWLTHAIKEVAELEAPRTPLAPPIRFDSSRFDSSEEVPGLTARICHKSLEQGKRISWECTVTYYGQAGTLLPTATEHCQGACVT
jgi:hypothetical protein